MNLKFKFDHRSAKYGIYFCKGVSHLRHNSAQFCFPAMQFGNDNLLEAAAPCRNIRRLSRHAQTTASTMGSRHYASVCRRTLINCGPRPFVFLGIMSSKHEAGKRFSSAVKWDMAVYLRQTAVRALEFSKCCRRSTAAITSLNVKFAWKPKSSLRRTRSVLMHKMSNDFICTKTDAHLPLTMKNLCVANDIWSDH